VKLNNSGFSCPVGGTGGYTFYSAIGGYTDDITPVTRIMCGITALVQFIVPIRLRYISFSHLDMSVSAKKLGRSTPAGIINQNIYLPEFTKSLLYHLVYISFIVISA